MKTLIVKSIDIIEVPEDRDYYRIARYLDNGFPILPEGEIPIDMAMVHEETIYPKIFINNKENFRLRVGLSKQAQDVIGIHYEAWDSMQRFLDDTLARNVRLLDELRQFKTMSFWDRVKFLFKKGKNDET